MNLKMALCEMLVDGWTDDNSMGTVINRAWSLSNTVPANEVERYTKAAELLRVRHISTSTKTRVWIAQNMPKLNNVLWDGRPRDVCVSAAQKALVGKTVLPSARFRLRVKENDKKHDWNTVK